MKKVKINFIRGEVLLIIYVLIICFIVYLFIYDMGVLHDLNDYLAKLDHINEINQYNYIKHKDEIIEVKDDIIFVYKCIRIYVIILIVLIAILTIIVFMKKKNIN